MDPLSVLDDHCCGIILRHLARSACGASSTTLLAPYRLVSRTWRRRTLAPPRFCAYVFDAPPGTMNPAASGDIVAMRAMIDETSRERWFFMLYRYYDVATRSIRARFPFLEIASFADVFDNLCSDVKGWPGIINWQSLNPVRCLWRAHGPFACDDYELMKKYIGDFNKAVIVAHLILVTGSQNFKDVMLATFDQFDYARAYHVLQSVDASSVQTRKTLYPNPSNPNERIFEILYHVERHSECRKKMQQVMDCMNGFLDQCNRLYIDPIKTHIKYEQCVFAHYEKHGRVSGRVRGQ
jgi:hypothetical protein